jgi:hypothetical protein
MTTSFEQVENSQRSAAGDGAVAALASAARNAWSSENSGAAMRDLPLLQSTEAKGMLDGFSLASKETSTPFDSLLGGKQEQKLANGVEIKAVGDGKFELKLGKYDKPIAIDMANGTARGGKVDYNVTTSKDGTVTLTSKSGATKIEIGKDGSLKTTTEDEDEKVVTERPADGKYEKKTVTDKDTGKTVEMIDRFGEKIEMKGYEMSFEANGTREGKTTVKTPDGRVITLEHQQVTVTEKDGTKKTYGPKDGPQVTRGGETRSDWYVQLPGGIVANFGHNGRSAIEVTDAKGSVTTAKFGEGKPVVELRRGK